MLITVNFSKLLAIRRLILIVVVLFFFLPSELELFGGFFFFFQILAQIHFINLATFIDKVHEL